MPSKRTIYRQITLGLFFITSLLMLTALPAQAEIYKWVDENGKTHFGDRKLQHVQQEEVKLKIKRSEWQRFDIQVETLEADISDAERQHIIDSVNNVYEFYDRVLFFDIYKTVPVKILILKDQQAYYRYLTEKTGKRPPPSYGIYYSKDNQIIVYIQEDHDRTFKTIAHEVSHAIVDTITPYTPTWLNEGLAEQMETLSKEDGQLTISSHALNKRSVDYRFKNKNLMDILTFLRLPSKEWRHTQTRGQNSLQAQAGQFVFFLLSTPPNRSFIVRLMHNFERGNRTISYYLVDDNYIGGIKTLSLSWKNWLRNASTSHITL